MHCRVMRYCVVFAYPFACAALGAQPLIDDVNVSGLAVDGFLGTNRQTLATSIAPKRIDDEDSFAAALAACAALLDHVLLQLVIG